MNESSLESNSQRPSMSRKSFLKLLGLGGAAVTAAYLGYDKLDAVEEKLSQMELSGKLRAGMFDLEKIGNVSNLENLKRELILKTESLKGVSASGLYISDIDQNAHIETGNYTEKFIAASLVKIPLMYEVWKKGQKDNTQYLTKDIADRVLGKSESCKNFIMELPYNKDKKPEEINTVIGNMLQNSGIGSEIDEDGNINVNLNEIFSFIRKTELPQIMMDSMRQTEDDDENNYGISAILRSNSKNENDIFFKIGLAQKDTEVTNSYVFLIGDNIKAVGYARGENVQQVHEQMLYSGAVLAKYSSK